MASKVQTLNKVFRKIYKAKYLTLRDWGGIFAASVALLRARIQFARLPIKVIFGKLGFAPQGSDLLTEDQQIIAVRISKSVRLAAANLPWRTDCIIQAMAAQHLLKRHEIKSSGFVGINRSNDNLATAHMWLKTGDIFITGQTSKKFKSVISLTDTKVAL